MSNTSDLIRRMKDLASDPANFEELVQCAHMLAALSPRSTGGMLPVGTNLFRATTHHVAVPSSIEELWFAPKHIVRSFGRANSPGRPIFYCCSDQNGAFLEMRVGQGQYAVLATWTTTRPLIVHEVGYIPEVLDHPGEVSRLHESHREFHEQLPQEMREIREFLFRAFTDPTPVNYVATAAIADLFLAADAIAGIMYPSIAKQGRVDNLALTPDAVRTGLSLSGATLALLDDVTPAGIGGGVIAELQSSTLGSLSWKYTGSTTDIPPYSAVEILIKPGDRKRLTSAGELELNGRRYRFLPGYFIELDGSGIVLRDLQGKIAQPIS
jgi:hypothetical protein